MQMQMQDCRTLGAFVLKTWLSLYHILHIMIIL